MPAGARSPRRDDATDRARTILWFESLKFELGASSPRAIERAVAPSESTDALGGLIKNNKFLGYARGDHVPHRDIVQRAERLYPESAVILKHVLWDALRDGLPLEDRADDLVRRLRPDIQRITPLRNRRVSLTPHTLGMLERRPGLDSLASLTILFRLTHQAGDTHSSWEISCSTFRTLMMLAPAFFSDAGRRTLFTLFSRKIFDAVTSPLGYRIDAKNYNYPDKSLAFIESFWSLAEDDSHSFFAYRWIAQQCISGFVPLDRKGHSRLHALASLPYMLVPAGQPGAHAMANVR